MEEISLGTRLVTSFLCNIIGHITVWGGDKLWTRGTRCWTEDPDTPDRPGPMSFT